MSNVNTKQKKMEIAKRKSTVTRRRVTLTGKVQLKTTLLEYRKLLKLARKGDCNLRIELEKKHAEYFDAMREMVAEDLESDGYFKRCSKESIMNDIVWSFDTAVERCKSNSKGPCFLENIWKEAHDIEEDIQIWSNMSMSKTFLRKKGLE